MPVPTKYKIHKISKGQLSNNKLSNVQLAQIMVFSMEEWCMYGYTVLKVSI